MERQLSQDTTERLKAYFAGREDVMFAYLFGSYAKGTVTDDSDIDFAIYFKPKGRALEYEEDIVHESAEEIIWSDVEHIVETNIDLIVLNRAPSNLFMAALEEGIPLLIRDRSLWWRLYLAVSDAALEFRTFLFDFATIKARSRSLTEIDHARLVRLVDFLEQELPAFAEFRDVTQKQYQEIPATKRNMERWAELIAVASIDIGKILLASTKLQMPKNYKEIMENLSLIKNFNVDFAKKLGEFSKLRNLLAHEYLDIRFTQLSKFIKEGELAYRYLLDFTKKFITAIAQGKP